MLTSSTPLLFFYFIPSTQISLFKLERDFALPLLPFLSERAERFKKLFLADD